jgi:threonine aldolase
MSDLNAAIDLRSDTVTQPGQAMRQAIADAEVGDDVLGRDPTVDALEKRVAAILGKEAALFVPSGTMANQISVRRHCPPGSEVILDRGSHILNYEAGATFVLSGVGFFPLDGERGLLDPDAVRDAIRPPVRYLPQTALILAENTHNSAGGTVWPLARLNEIGEIAREAGLPFHLDGARIWNAAAATGDTPADIAAPADSITVSISKGLGAPVGSLVVGSHDFIDGCWAIRRQLGGAMRQSGVLAAAGLYGLDHHLPRLQEDHTNARSLAERLNALPGVSVDLDATQTNIVIFDVAGAGRGAEEVTAECERRGVLICPFGPTLLRAVTHLDIDRSDIDRAGRVFEEMFSHSASGKEAAP